MKKRLLYLSAFVLVAFVFAACGEDEVPGWKEIPAVEIKGENATLTLNGQSSNGSVQLSVTNETSAALKLNNIVRGFESMSVDVVLAEKQDGSFDFSGEKTISSVPTRAEAAVTTTVKVKGNVTLEGKATVEVKTEFSGGITASWLVPDDMLLNAEMSAYGHTPWYFTWKSPKHIIASGMFKGEVISEQLSGITQWFLPALLSDALYQIKFGADGNITAKYYTGTEYTINWIFDHQLQLVPTSGKTWLDSPSDLAYWYVKGDKLYVVPNLGNIIALVGKTDVGAGGMDFSAILEVLKGMKGAEIKEMLAGLIPKDFPLNLSQLSDAKVEEIVGWLSTGIPLNYNTSEVETNYGKKVVGLRVYVDQAFVEPFMPLLFPMLPMLDNLVKESAPDLFPLMGMVGITSFTDIETIWQGTEEFNLGIELTDKSYLLK